MISLIQNSWVNRTTRFFFFFFFFFFFLRLASIRLMLRKLCNPLSL